MPDNKTLFKGFYYSAAFFKINIYFYIFLNVVVV